MYEPAGLVSPQLNLAIGLKALWLGLSHMRACECIPGNRERLSRSQRLGFRRKGIDCYTEKRIRTSNARTKRFAKKKNTCSSFECFSASESVLLLLSYKFIFILYYSVRILYMIWHETSLFNRSHFSFIDKDSLEPFEDNGADRKIILKSCKRIEGCIEGTHSILVPLFHRLSTAVHGEKKTALLPSLVQ